MDKTAEKLGLILSEGEHVLWQGQPTHAPIHPRRNAKDITVTLVVIAGLLGARECFVLSPVLRIVLLLLSLMLCGILCIILVLEPFAERRQARQTFYAITPERAIIISGKRVFSQRITPDTRFRLSGTTPETLEIWDATDQARAEVPPMRFQHLPDGEAAAVLQRLLTMEAPPDT